MVDWSDKLKGVAHEVDRHRLTKPKRTFGDLNDNKKKPKLKVVKEELTGLAVNNVQGGAIAGLNQDPPVRKRKKMGHVVRRR